MDNIYFKMDSFNVGSAYASLNENGFIIIKNYFQESQIDLLRNTFR